MAPSDPTNIDSVVQVTLRNTQNWVFKANAALKDSYIGTTFAKFAEAVKDGRDPGTNPPQPPMAYEVAYFADELTGPGTSVPVQVKWAFPKVGNVPVCAIPTIPFPQAQIGGTWLIGLPDADGNGAWFHALPGDKTPNRAVKVATAQDGTHGPFQKYGSIGTSAGWFLFLPMSDHT